MGLIACVLNFCLKLLAVVLQQKGIGEPLSNNLAVRQYVKVHSPECRAFELILRTPGLSFAKVCVLIGGPDWPVSVFTGILRLPCLQMVLGTTPVIFNVVLVTGAGALKIREDEKLYGAMGGAIMSFAAVWNMLQMVGCFYFMQETWEKYHDPFLSKPRKDHVLLYWLDEIAAKQKEKVDE